MSLLFCYLFLSAFPVFFFNDTATTEIYTLSLHDALPIFGRAALAAASSVDLPAFGNPTSPTSAINLSSSHNQRDSPGSPTSAKPGVWRVDVLPLALPRPPRRPRAVTTRFWFLLRSALG